MRVLKITKKWFEDHSLQASYYRRTVYGNYNLYAYDNNKTVGHRRARVINGYVIWNVNGELFKTPHNDFMAAVKEFGYVTFYGTDLSSFKSVPSTEVIETFCKSQSIDMDSLDRISHHTLTHYIKSFLRDTIVSDSILESTKNDDPFYVDDFPCYAQADIDRHYLERLNKSAFLIQLKYSLLKGGVENKFSGTHKISFFRFTGNDKVNTFDVMQVDLNMLSLHNENLDFLRKNAGKVQTLLKEIVENHPKSKKYANYLRLYDLALTRENVLVAKFCFKDGLEKLCKEV